MTPTTPQSSDALNAASSRSCFVTWWTPPHSPISSTRKISVPWCGPIKRRAPRIARFEGHIAQYLGDGLLVYFGHPLAHEDDAQRAVRTGLGIVEALGQLNTRLGQAGHLAVRLGIHTGLVVVGDVGEAPAWNSWHSARPPTSPPACKASPRPIR